MKRLVLVLAGFSVLAAPVSFAWADAADIQEDEATLTSLGQDLTAAQDHMEALESQLAALEHDPVANAAQIAALLADQTATQVRIDEDLAELAIQGGDLAGDEYFGTN